MFKNSVKKYLSLLLTLVLLLSSLGFAVRAEETTETTEITVGDKVVVYDEETGEELVYDEEGNLIEFPDELRVGHPTITKGDFFTEMFGNDTADIDVRALLHGYNLVNWDQNQGVYLIDESVVEDVLVVENEVGDRTYFLALYDDLYYCDGTPITAWDYAFSLLLMMSPEIEQIGGKIYRAEHILGYDEYITGRVPYLEGVGVIDEHQLAITLDHEFLPYFFETGLLLCVPYPISVIAPGCKVYSDGLSDLGDGYGYGIYIGNEDLSVEERLYTAELLKETILDPETGYNSHPSVTSGPYKLLDYDYVTAHFEINDYYKGAWMYNTLPDNFQFNVKELAGTGWGALRHNSRTGPSIYKVDRLDENGEENPMYLVKPTIEHISFTVADNDTMAQDLADGTFHLVNKVVYGPTIDECLGIGGDEFEETEPGDDVPEDEARRLLAMFVSDCFNSLKEGKKVVLNQIGTLSYDWAGDLAFAPDNAVNYNADAFGLCDFTPEPVLRSKTKDEIKEEIERQQKDKNTPVTVDEKEVHKKEEDDSEDDEPRRLGWLWIVLGILLVAGIVFGLHYFKVIDLEKLIPGKTKRVIDIKPGTYKLPTYTVDWADVLKQYKET